MLSDALGEEHLLGNESDHVTLLVATLRRSSALRQSKREKRIGMVNEVRTVRKVL
jgi:hypothetical protein